MITVTSIKMLDKTRDNQWAIVRSMKSSSPWITQVPELSPSKELFFEYLRLRNAGQWNKETFEKVYVPWFLRDMKTYGAPMLNRVYLMNRQGIDITMGCFCQEEDTCHRSIVAGLLQGAGCSVATQTGADYSRYFQMFKSI